MADNRNAPWSAQEPLPCQSAHVGHVRIVDWKAKDPGTGQPDRPQDTRQTGGKTILRFWSRCETLCEKDTGINVYIPLHLSAPEDVLLLVHEDGEVLVLALLDGVRPGGDGPHLVELKEQRESEIFNSRDAHWGCGNICFEVKYDGWWSHVLLTDGFSLLPLGATSVQSWVRPSHSVFFNPALHVLDQHVMSSAVAR